jgi:pimeloyl-ACP methyl ester carboxylesterase
VLTYDPAGEGERNPERKSGTRAHDNLERVPELGRRQAGLMQTDLMQAVSYLQQRDEIDPRRIAVMGYSMGSFVASITGAIDTRIRAAVLVGGGNLDGPGEYWDNAKPMCQGYPYQALAFLGDRAAVLYALHGARGPTLIYNGLEDSVVNIPKTGPPFFADLRDRTVKRMAGAEGVFDTDYLAGASHRPYFVTRPVAAWLEAKLDFPNWTARGIEDMAETHIAEWAKQYEVEMDPLYATEHREGGTAR